MDSLKLKLTGFEGPLDLLLYLVERNKIDIYDIPIVSVTEQYMSYLQDLEEFDLDIASNFIGLASILMQLKSRMLLPSEDKDPEGEEDPAVRLGEMLAEYKKVKGIVALLEKLKLEADKYIARPPMFKGVVEYSLCSRLPSELMQALAALSESGNNAKPEAYIDRQAFSVRRQMATIMSVLARHPEGITLRSLLRTRDAGEKVATFLGVLELLRLGMIAARQSEQFAPIFIFSNPEGKNAQR